MPYYGAIPGQSALTETTEKQVTWGRDTDLINAAIHIKSAAVDAGNTPTTTIRAGMVMGKQTADGLYDVYDPDASDGTETPRAILLHDVDMLDAQGTAEAKTVSALFSGPVKASQILIEGTVLTSSGDEDLARSLMGQFLLDDAAPPAPGAGSTGTTAASFEVDNDSTIPKIALASQTAGTGNFTTTLKPETTLSADNAIIVPEADGDTLVAVALAQTLTSKTLTNPTVNAASGVVVIPTAASPAQTTEGSIVWDSDDDLLTVGDGASRKTMCDTAKAQTLTNKTLASPVITTQATGAGSTFVPFIPIGPHTTSVAAAAAIPITNFYSTLDSNAGATTQTLADGAIIGQLKKIQMIVDGGDDVVTPTNLAGGTIITFADVGDYALLMWSGTEWVAIELGNDADGVTAPVLS